MVKKMLEVVVNYLYPALTTVKTDWLFLCTPDSVMFATQPLSCALHRGLSPCSCPLLPQRQGQATAAVPTSLTLRAGPGSFRKQPASQSPALATAVVESIKPTQALRVTSAGHATTWVRAEVRKGGGSQESLFTCFPQNAYIILSWGQQERDTLNEFYF